jgi:SAM-dependent methyltransferase
MATDDGRPKVPDSWAKGELYEPYVGRWSRLVAADFLAWLSLPANGRWLDVGCGTGALSETILHNASPKSVIGIDPSPEYISFARQKLADNRATFNVGSAESLDYQDGVFDAAVSGLALNFVPHPGQAVAQMKRVTVSGGIVAAYVWDYADKTEFMRYFWDAAVELDRGAMELDEGLRFPLCKPGPLKILFESHGLRRVEVRSIVVETFFRDFDDYWSPFLGGTGPAPSYAVSLTEERRDALRNRIHTKLPVSGDGSISLTARVWAVRGLNTEGGS